jgi:predicted RNA-binding Zn-ribbon protein involved in translation (DUF1610 family)
MSQPDPSPRVEELIGLLIRGLGVLSEAVKGQADMIEANGRLIDATTHAVLHLAEQAGWSFCPRCGRCHRCQTKIVHDTEDYEP